MNLHLALVSNSHITNYFSGRTHEIYGLYSYHYCKKNKDMMEHINKFKGFILDSGVFTFLNGTDTKGYDWEKYIHDYAEFVKKWNIKNYVEVDIDKIIGYDEVKRLRTKLEKQVGWKTMPVWHINRGYEDWLRTTKDYDYACFGAFLTDGLKKDKYPYIIKFIQDAHKNKCLVHGLGMSGTAVHQLPFYSVDSSSWGQGGRWGQINRFDGKIILATRAPKGMQTADPLTITRHNVDEWIKYATYLEHNL